MLFNRIFREQPLKSLSGYQRVSADADQSVTFLTQT